jgi:mRNA-degrading endonuclease RelE of RelBE toxin-antitoxin system
MPRIIYTEQFRTDLIRIKKFLNNLDASIHQKFLMKFREKLEIIKNSPEAFLSFGENRIYFLSFGASGYVVQYYYDKNFEIIKLLRIKHQKEVGF